MSEDSSTMAQLTRLKKTEVSMKGGNIPDLNVHLCKDLLLQPLLINPALLNPRPYPRE